MSNETTYREAYRPYPFEVPETRLAFDLRDDETVVTSALVVERKPGTADPLVLDGVGLDLRRIAVDGVPLRGNEYAVDGESLTIFEVGARCLVEVTVAIKPEENEALEGLYKSKSLYCTQCEAEGFRHVTYYPDRPDVLSRFTTTIAADAERFPVLLSNGNATATGTEPDGRHRVTWHDPFPKPAYLFALVAGDLAVLEDEFVTRSGRNVALRIFSEPHNIGKCEFPMAVLKRAMRWDEDRFGREYDLDVFMVVAVEDFNAGAMENKGLNIFNISAFLAHKDSATDDRFAFVEAVVAHEYFHNWSGNRVTCRDWFQLSLKEGFTVYRDQEFSADMNWPALCRIKDVELLRNEQFVEDAGPLAHPVRPDSYVEISNFYTRTVYEKGAEVVRMIATLLGPDRFRAGCDRYFDTHDGNAVTIEDFVKAMEDASGFDLSLFRRWYAQAGTPTLRVRERRFGATLELAIRQSCDPTPGQTTKQPLPVPLALGLVSGGQDALGAAGTANGFHVGCEAAAAVENPNADGTLVVRLDEAETTLSFRNAPPEAEVSLLRGLSAPVKVDHPRRPGALRQLALHDTELFSRWDAAQTLLGNAVLATVSGSDGATDEALSMVRALAAAAHLAPDDGQAKALIAASLALPKESWLLELAPGTDILAIVRAREAMTERIADAVDWLAIVEANSAGEYKPELPDIARRKLKHQALHYALNHLDRTEPDRARDLVASLLTDADNLTDRAAALRGLVGLASLGEHEKAHQLEAFYQEWSTEALVVDQWFTVQAQNPLPGGLNRVRALQGHEAFNSKNPNKVRALVAAFANGNPRNFHDGDEGYRWFAETIAEIDAFNRNVAARLARTLIGWRRHDSSRARAMRGALEWLQAHDLSTDTREIVDKGLQTA
ncbi:MAG: aminopeptidase N [Gammaproteobacteria bacterium]|nr:aminopeptidase N [Gammaproteobacteria bacterium]